MTTCQKTQKGQYGSKIAELQNLARYNSFLAKRSISCVIVTPITGIDQILINNS